IDKNASRKQQYHRKDCQKGKYSVQKEIFDNGFKSSLPIKFSHGLVQVYTKNDDKDTRTANIENGVQYQAKDEQDKQQRLIVKAEDQMIGVGIFFPDVHQPNEDGEHRHEEENDKGEFGNGGVHKPPRLLLDSQGAVARVKGHFVGPGVLNPILCNGLIKRKQSVPFDSLDEELHLVGERIEVGFVFQL